MPDRCFLKSLRVNHFFPLLGDRWAFDLSGMFLMNAKMVPSPQFLQEILEITNVLYYWMVEY